MYEQGMLSKPNQCQHEKDENGYCPEWCFDFDRWHSIRDKDGTKDQFFLPHSCDEWVIGGVDELRLLVADAMALLEEEQ